MKFKKFFQNIFKKFFQLLFHIAYGRVKIITNNSQIKLKRHFPEKILISNKEHKIENVIYEIPNARVYTDLIEHVAIIKDNIILPEISYQQVKGDLKKINYNKVLKSGTPRIKKKFKGNILSLIQGASGNNFFHFLFDILPKIKIIQDTISLNDIDYFFMPSNAKWQNNILSKFDIPEDKIINSQKYRHIKADKIYALDHPWYKKGFVQKEIINLPEWIIFFLRDKFLKYAKKFNNSEKIFIDRSDSSFLHCKLINNEEIIKFLSENGFQSYQVSKLDFFEQVYLFNKAKVIIGPHGAAFSNIIFSNPGLELIELIPKNHPSIKCDKISKILNFNYKRINLDNSKKKEEKIIGDMKIEISLLKEILNSINKN